MVKRVIEVFVSGLIALSIGNVKGEVKGGLERLEIDNINISETMKEGIEDTQIYITNSEIEEMEEYKNYFGEDSKFNLGSVGLYDKERNVIYIEGDEEYTLLHEIAHAYDNKKEKKLSDMADFEIIYKQEAKKLFNKSTYPNYSEALINYYTGQRNEYYAESFAIYKTYPEQLKNIAPMTYNYMVKIDK